MTIDQTAWITGGTAFANLVAAAANTHRSNAELGCARQAADESLDRGEFSIGEVDIAPMQKSVIGESLPQAFIEDIVEAQKRSTPGN